MALGRPQEAQGQRSLPACSWVLRPLAGHPRTKTHPAWSLKEKTDVAGKGSGSGENAWGVSRLFLPRERVVLAQITAGWSSISETLCPGLPCPLSQGTLSGCRPTVCPWLSHKPTARGEASGARFTDEETEAEGDLTPAKLCPW